MIIIDLVLGNTSSEKKFQVGLNCGIQQVTILIHVHVVLSKDST